MRERGVSWVALWLWSWGGCFQKQRNKSGLSGCQFCLSESRSILTPQPEARLHLCSDHLLPSHRIPDLSSRGCPSNLLTPQPTLPTLA